MCNLAFILKIVMLRYEDSLLRCNKREVHYPSLDCDGLSDGQRVGTAL